MSENSPKLEWYITPWSMNGDDGWRQQPVILIEGQIPFYATHPDAYIAKLQEMHDDPKISRGPFYAFIGQLRDALEQSWKLVT